jgi:5-methylcytosine-specific restriction endonuclease McrA
MHNSGFTDKEIAEKLGCERSNITYHLNKMGLNNRQSKKDNIDLRNRISQSLIGRFVGDKNPNYKGYTDEKTIARGIFKTISKRKIRENDYTCQHCGRHGGDLETHHIKPFNIIFLEFIRDVYSGNIENIYDELMNYEDFINEDNLVVLCDDCHYKVHYSDDHELSPYRWESATTIENA